MRGHPNMSVFEGAERHGYPLILIVGREPNGDSRMVNVVGPYDFRDHARCGFWNTSYAIVARTVGLQTWQFKQRCVALGGSPIVYTDALPWCVPNAVKDKWTARLNIPAAEIRQHVAEMFSHTLLMSRVRLVILSGLNDCVFETSCDTIESSCRQLHIRCIRLPFFHGMHSKTIDRALEAVDRELIHDIVNVFLAAPTDLR